jgi:hypothetical protein
VDEAFFFVTPLIAAFAVARFRSNARVGALVLAVHAAIQSTFALVAYAPDIRLGTIRV